MAVDWTDWLNPYRFYLRQFYLDMDGPLNDLDSIENAADATNAVLEWYEGSFNPLCVFGNGATASSYYANLVILREGLEHANNELGEPGTSDMLALIEAERVRLGF